MPNSYITSNLVQKLLSRHMDTSLAGLLVVDNYIRTSYNYSQFSFNAKARSLKSRE